MDNIEFDRATRISDEHNVEHPCQKCGVNPNDLGAAAMCVSCGEFLLCGPCTMLAETGAENGRPTVACHICHVCAAEYEKKKETPHPGLCLKKLLKNKPEGRHVNYARLMLAQLRLYDLEEYCGIPPSRKKAKEEFLRLADEEDYALAQFAVASFYDPIDGEIWDGPLNLNSLMDDAVNSPFSPNARKAKEFYDKAVANKCTMAIQTVGTMYKNGELYPCVKVKAAQMLKEAVDMGDPRAMCNLGQMQMKGDGIPQDLNAGMDLYMRAATKYDIWSAQFMVGQIGMQIPQYRQEGKKMITKLANQDWEPPTPMHEAIFEQMLEFYDI